MKFWKNLMKFLASLAAACAVVYVVITYGDKIIAWAKRTFGKYFPCCCDCFEEELSEEITEEPQEETSDENVAEETDFEA